MTLSARILDTLINARWRPMLECLAEQLGMAVAMVNVVDTGDLLVAQVSDSEGRFQRGQRISLKVNSYCSNILRSGEQLFISDVRRLPALEDCNPTAALGLVHYYGEPIHDADGRLVATLCVMDSKPRAESSGVRHLVRLLRDSIQDELRSRVHAEQLDALRLQVKAATESVLSAMSRGGLAGAHALAELGFTDAEVQHHLSLMEFAGLVEPQNLVFPAEIQRSSAI